MPSPILMTAILSLALVHGWLYSDNHTPRVPDGSLRCYQCNSSDDPAEKDRHKSVCTLSNWRHANVSEKRNMIMQCPKSMSSFCNIMIGTKDDSKTFRGCSGAKFSNGKTANLGCFFMGDEYRVCLCDQNLCNRADRRCSLNVLFLVSFAFSLVL